jgi:hypothetical protein
VIYWLIALTMYCVYLHASRVHFKDVHYIQEDIRKIKDDQLRKHNEVKLAEYASLRDFSQWTIDDSFVSFYGLDSTRMEDRFHIQYLQDRLNKEKEILKKNCDKQCP